MFPDFLQHILTGVDIATGILQLGIFEYLISGGWITIIRSISFFLDKLFISFISKFFDYFFKIIDGTLIVPETIETITKNLYFFIALILLFKLGAFILKYIMNPEMVHDENIGVHSLVKRVIIGMVLLIFMPTIFNISRQFQSAILADKVIEKVIMDKASLNKYNALLAKAPIGRIIGFSVFQGFWSYDNTKFGSALVNNQYKNALDRYDPSDISINAGGRVGYATNYYYDYFPILSTIALGYVLYLIIKLCLDVLIRSFNLTILQIISPLTVSDYMISGDKQGVFSNWVKTTLASYLMLFIRVLSLWFLIWVCMQMQMTNSECVTNLTNQGISVEQANSSCGSSILFLNENGSPDMLLRAMIIIALLAFIMDLPKLFTKIFGLDLEQESSVTGMINKVGGIGKMVGLGGVAFAGGMLGGAIGSIKGGAQALTGLKTGKAVNQAKMSNLTNQYQSDLKALDKNSPDYAQNKAALTAKYNADKNKIEADNRKLERKALHQASAATKGMAFGGLAAAAKQTSIGGAFAGGYSNSNNSSQNKVKESGDNYDMREAPEKAAEDYQKKIAEEAATTAYREHQINVTDQINATTTAIAGQQTASNLKLDNLVGLSDQTLQENRNVNIKLGTNVNVDSDKTMEKANAAYANGFNYQDSIAGKLDQSVEETRNINVKLGTNINVDSDETMEKANDSYSKGFSYQDSVGGKLDQSIEETRNLDFKISTNMNVEDETLTDTIGGVKVSSPDSKTKERATEAGIILPGSIDLDKK